MQGNDQYATCIGKKGEQKTGRRDKISTKGNALILGYFSVTIKLRVMGIGLYCRVACSNA